jgi:hypothetical protein
VRASSPSCAGKKSRQLLEESESDGEEAQPAAKRGKVRASRGGQACTLNIAS